MGLQITPRNTREGGELSLDELIADPIAHLLMRCDGTTADEVRRVLLSTQDRLERRRLAAVTMHDVAPEQCPVKKNEPVPQSANRIPCDQVKRQT